MLMLPICVTTGFIVAYFTVQPMGIHVDMSWTRLFTTGINLDITVELLLCHVDNYNGTIKENGKFITMAKLCQMETHIWESDLM